MNENTRTRKYTYDPPKSSGKRRPVDLLSENSSVAITIFVARAEGDLFGPNWKIPNRKNRVFSGLLAEYY